jgi:V/A-type H+-transporting ATPase subunit E
MQNKLQELTDKLYNEGLAKGKQEAGNLLEQARKQADEIIAQANAKADQILADARREAEDLKVRVEGDVKMASNQTVSALRQQIAQMIETKTVGGAVDATLADGKFMGKLLETIAGAFNAGGAQASLDVILPEAMKGSLETFLKQNISSELAKGMSFSFSDDIEGGFRIAPKDGGYYLDFSDESFKALLGEYLRPATKKILFG